MKNFKFSARAAAPVFTLMCALSLVACGKQAFVVTSSAENQQAPGVFTIAPKVDILFVQDDTGDILEPQSAIDSQLSGFLSTMNSNGWDYRFGVVPLTTDQPFTQAMASTYDGNWGSQWVAPYPGALQASVSMPANLFQMPGSFTGFQVSASNSKDGNEPAFETMRLALQNRIPNTGFLRSDAMLAIIVLSAGQDTSKIAYCKQAQNSVTPCENLAAANQVFDHCGQYNSNGTLDVNPADCTTSALSQSYYQAQFQAVKSSASLLKMYAAVSTSRNSNCLATGGETFAGTRYANMAASLGGQSYDICSQPLTDVLSGVASNLQATSVSFETRYLFAATQPDPTTITVTKYPGGDTTQGEVIAQDPNNGWTYAGPLTNVYTIDAPVPMNLASGYAIELHGSAKLLGSDTAALNYKPFGASNASAK